MTVDSLINGAESRANSLLSGATSAINTATSAISNMGYTQVTFTPLPIPQQPSPPDALTPPTLTDAPFDMSDQAPDTPIYDIVQPFEAGVAPLFTASAPAINLPSKPSQLSAFSQVLPSLNLNVSLPPAPSLIMPPEPTFTERAEPDAPTVQLPTFDGQMPVDTTVVPTGIEASFNAAYREASPTMTTAIAGYVDAQLVKMNPQYHAQMAAIEGQLTKYLAGGTGLKPEVEDAIYARAQAKNDLEAKRVQDAVLADTAARGFTLPTGVMAAAMIRARQDAANNNAKAASEIAIAQAEMEQKNLQFAVTTSAGLRATVLNATLSYMQNLTTINGQALDYAKSVLSSIIEMYNTSVKAFTAKLEAYKAEASVYEVRMRGALTGIEIYKAEISALQALTQVDHSKVEVYKARIDVLTAMTSMYRTRVEAMVSAASLERLKVDAFQAQVQAYGAQVQAKNAEWQGYSAEISGETAKVQVYAAQAQAYSAQVQGYRAEVEAKGEVSKAAAATNAAMAQQYAAASDGYKAVVMAKGEVARTKIENQRVSILAYQAATHAQVASAQMQTESYKAAQQVAIENAKLTINAMVTSAEMKHKYAEALARISNSNAVIHGNLAGSALAGINALASQSITE